MHRSPDGSTTCFRWQASHRVLSALGIPVAHGLHTPAASEYSRPVHKEQPVRSGVGPLPGSHVWHVSPSSPYVMSEHGVQVREKSA